MQGSPRPNLSELIAEGQWSEVREAVARCPAPDVADLLPSLKPVDRILVFRLLPRELASEALTYLAPEAQDELLRALTDEETRTLLNNIEPDDRTRLFGELPGVAIQRLLNLLSPEDRRETVRLLGYPEESVGRMMTPDYIAVRPVWTVDRALQHIRARRPAPDVVHVVYVVDERWKLLDMLELPVFVLADPAGNVEAIMDRAFVALSPYDDREQAVQTMLKYDVVALPVVDAEGVLLGVVTFDDVFDVAEEEATEDFQISAGVTPLRAPYPAVGIRELFSKRMPWLAALLMAYVVTTGVIAAYEQALAAQIVLVSFIPLLMGSGGNVGAQSGTLMVRSLATGELRGTAWFRTFGKEVLVGALLGLAMGGLAAALGHVRGGAEVAIVVSTAMLLIVTVANLVGFLLPLGLTRLGIDPAVAGNPLITSLTDITSLTIYFWIATRVLGL